MKRTTTLLAATFLLAIACCAVCRVHADYLVHDRGTWPASWPEELEPLRTEARTLEGGQTNVVFYEIPFTTREQFESAWPHLLKIQSKGIPLILVRSPDKTFGRIEAGVRIKCPPRQAGNETTSALTQMELIVDGKIVDLNRVPLPAERPIIDRRFLDAQNE